MLELLATGLIGALSGSIGAYVVAKKFLKPEIILDFSDVLLNELMQNVEYQKRIYVLGGLLGQGIKQGIGLPKTGGKFKIEDAIGALIGGFVQNIGANMFSTAQAQTQPPNPQKKVGISKSF